MFGVEIAEMRVGAVAKQAQGEKNFEVMEGLWDESTLWLRFASQSLVN